MNRDRGTALLVLVTQAEGLGDLLHVSGLIGQDETDADAVRASSTGPSDTMDKSVLVFGEVVVDDVSDIGDVDTSSRDISGHESVHLAVLEIRQRALTLVLRLVAMHGRCPDLG